MEKQRKPLSEEALQKLAAARELANKKRKEMAEKRKEEKETIVKQKLEEEKQKKIDKLEKYAAKEVKKRLSHEVSCEGGHSTKEQVEEVVTEEKQDKPPKKKDAVVVEYSSSDSDDFDFEDARVLFVKKERHKEPNMHRDTKQPPPRQVDPLASAYRNMFGPRLF